MVKIGIDEQTEINQKILERLYKIILIFPIGHLLNLGAIIDPNNIAAVLANNR